jgi:hypothetical protein
MLAGDRRVKMHPDVADDNRVRKFTVTCSYFCLERDVLELDDLQDNANHSTNP